MVIGKKRKPIRLRKKESEVDDLVFNCENYILKDYMPYLAAVTANVNSDVQKLVEAAGFNNLYSVPLTVSTI